MQCYRFWLLFYNNIEKGNEHETGLGNIKMLKTPNSLLELLQLYGTKITKADMIGGDYGRSWERRKVLRNKTETIARNEILFITN